MLIGPEISELFWLLNEKGCREMALKDAERNGEFRG